MRLNFKDVFELNKKTLTQDVLNNDLWLGQIKWYAPWRRYVFFPARASLFDASCMREIVSQIESLMKQRKESQSFPQASITLPSV